MENDNQIPKGYTIDFSDNKLSHKDSLQEHISYLKNKSFSVNRDNEVHGKRHAFRTMILATTLFNLNYSFDENFQKQIKQFAKEFKISEDNILKCLQISSYLHDSGRPFREEKEDHWDHDSGQNVSKYLQSIGFNSEISDFFGLSTAEKDTLSKDKDKNANPCYKLFSSIIQTSDAIEIIRVRDSLNTKYLTNPIEDINDIKDIRRKVINEAEKLIYTTGDIYELGYRHSQASKEHQQVEKALFSPALPNKNKIHFSQQTDKLSDNIRFKTKFPLLAKLYNNGNKNKFKQNEIMSTINNFDDPIIKQYNSQDGLLTRGILNPIGPNVLNVQDEHGQVLSALECEQKYVLNKNTEGFVSVGEVRPSVPPARNAGLLLANKPIPYLQVCDKNTGFGQKNEAKYKMSKEEIKNTRLQINRYTQQWSNLSHTETEISKKDLEPTGIYYTKLPTIENNTGEKMLYCDKEYEAYLKYLPANDFLPYLSAIAVWASLEPKEKLPIYEITYDHRLIKSKVDYNKVYRYALSLSLVDPIYFQNFAKATKNNNIIKNICQEINLYHLRKNEQCTHITPPKVKEKFDKIKKMEELIKEKSAIANKLIELENIFFHSKQELDIVYKDKLRKELEKTHKTIKTIQDELRAMTKSLSDTNYIQAKDCRNLHNFYPKENDNKLQIPDNHPTNKVNNPQTPNHNVKYTTDTIENSEHEECRLV